MRSLRNRSTSRRGGVNTSTTSFSPSNVLLVSPIGQTQPEAREQVLQSLNHRDQPLGSQNRSEMEENGSRKTGCTYFETKQLFLSLPHPLEKKKKIMSEAKGKHKTKFYRHFVS